MIIDDDPDFNYVSQMVLEAHNFEVDTATTPEVPYRFAPDEDYLPVDVFLDKPVEPEALVDIIKEILGERREEIEYPL